MASRCQSESWVSWTSRLLRMLRKALSRASAELGAMAGFLIEPISPASPPQTSRSVFRIGRASDRPHQHQRKRESIPLRGDERMKRNQKLFNEIADKIETDPGSYDQNVYGERTSCGTKHCIAGWAVSLRGYIPARIGWLLVRNEDSEEESVSDVATRLLGLRDFEDAMLFHSSWRPPSIYASVPEALRAFGAGAPIGRRSEESLASGPDAPPVPDEPEPQEEPAASELVGCS